MKKMIIVFVVAMGLSVLKADAQYVRVRPSFNFGISIGPRPYDDAIWIEPEWRWQNGVYVQIPGHWERTRKHSRWVQGRWIYTRRGYRWQEGRWRY